MKNITDRIMKLKNNIRLVEDKQLQDKAILNRLKKQLEQSGFATIEEAQNHVVQLMDSVETKTIMLNKMITSLETKLKK